MTAVRIGELAAEVGVTTKSVRFYESIGLLPEPDRSPSGYRVYGPADVERLTFIKSAQRLGFSLDEVREIVGFRDRGEQPCAYVAGVLQRQVRDVDRRIAELRRLREELRRLEAKASELGSVPGRYCGVIEHIREDVTAGPDDGRL